MTTNLDYKNFYKGIHRGRSRLLMLAILRWKYGHRFVDDNGKCRTRLYRTLHSYFPDTFKPGTTKIEKDAVLRKMVEDGLIGWDTSSHGTWRISLTRAGAHFLSVCEHDPRYSEELTLVREYHKGVWAEGKGPFPGHIAAAQKAAQKPVEAPPAEAEGAEITVAPGWDDTSDDARISHEDGTNIGWALTDGTGRHHLAANQDLLRTMARLRDEGHQSIVVRPLLVTA